MLESHPTVTCASHIGLHLSRVALAQHYGIPTDHLDLTQDPEIAAFFATCTVNQDEEWRPVSGGIGVLYRFDLTAFPRALGDTVIPELFRIVEMIGLQTLPRPGEQKAWTIRLPLGLDFERLPLDMFCFCQTEEGSQICHEKYQSGRVLFPPDVLADIAADIRAARTLSSTVVTRVLLEHGCRRDLIEEAAKTYAVRFREQFNIEISKREPIQLASNQMSIADAEVAAKRKEFLQNVGVRPVKISHVPTLIDLLQDHREWNRATAARVLGDLGERAKAALPALREALGDSSEAVRSAAGSAIQEIAGPCDGPG